MRHGPGSAPADGERGAARAAAHRGPCDAGGRAIRTLVQPAAAGRGARPHRRVSTSGQGGARRAAARSRAPPGLDEEAATRNPRHAGRGRDGAAARARDSSRRRIRPLARIRSAPGCWRPSTRTGSSRAHRMRSPRRSTSIPMLSRQPSSGSRWRTASCGSRPPSTTTGAGSRQRAAASWSCAGATARSRSRGCETSSAPAASTPRRCWSISTPPRLTRRRGDEHVLRPG